LAQRLVRVLCPNCKEQYEPSDEIYERIGLKRDSKITLYRAKGCLGCRHTGYKGRIGIFELLVMEEALRELITKASPLLEIREAAKKAGMKTLQQDGFDKTISGSTSLEEVLRVTYT